VATDRLPDAHLDAWRALLNVHAGVVERVEQALRDAGLPPLTWYDVLWALRRAPERRLRMGELAEAVTLSRGGLTKLVDRLEAGGFLRREACLTDRRGYHAVLTPRGQALLRRMWPVYADVLKDVFVPALGEDEADTIAASLGRVGESRIDASVHRLK
jgi:DNA-binding MarR family transcriptional regulator